jgi:hypothetical protein
LRTQKTNYNLLFPLGYIVVLSPIMRSYLLPLLCLASNVLAAPLIVDQYTESGGAPPPGKGDPPMEKYIARITSALTTLEQRINTVPRGGSVEDARRITGTLLQMQGNIIQDLKQGANEVRNFGPPPFMAAIGIDMSLSAPTSKLQGTMRGWIKEKQMVEVSGDKSKLVQQLNDFVGALSVFADACAAKVGVLSAGAVNTFKDQCRGSIYATIDAYGRR